MLTSAMTLREFFNEYYLVMVNPDMTPGGTRSYLGSIEKWEKLTGNPPVGVLTPQMLAEFRTALKEHTGLSTNSVLKEIRQLNAILRRLDTPSHALKIASGLHPNPPWIVPLKAEKRVKPPASDEAVAALYKAADRMDQPLSDQFTPGAWWRALLVWFYYVGSRTWDTLHHSDYQEESGAQFDRIKWKERRIHLYIRKKREWEWKQLKDIVLTHVRKIQGDRTYLFQWTSQSNGFYGQLHKLANHAGLKRRNHVTPHAIRRTVATNLAMNGELERARLHLGHSTLDVTLQHYIDMEHVRRGVDDLPELDVFKDGM